MTSSNDHRAGHIRNRRFLKPGKTRPNGVIASTVISGATVGFNAWLDLEQKDRHFDRSLRRFAASNVLRLDPRIAEEGAEFIIDLQFDLTSGVKHLSAFRRQGILSNRTAV